MEKIRTQCGKLGYQIALREISDAILKIKNNRSPGADGVRGEFLKHMGPWGLKLMGVLFNKCVLTCKVPQLWRRILLKPLVKKQDAPLVPDNFRPLRCPQSSQKFSSESLLTDYFLNVRKSMQPLITNSDSAEAILCRLRLPPLRKQC